MRRVAFIDRDGVIFRPTARMGPSGPTAPFSVDEAVLFDGLEDALALLRRHGFLRILVTNQPDVAHGHLTHEEWERIHGKLSHLEFDDEFVCFHRKEEGCECHKPKPGMLLEAQKKWNVDLARSYMIGDTDKDRDAGRAAGCKTIIIDAPYNQHVQGDFRAKNLHDAATIVVHAENETGSRRP